MKFQIIIQSKNTNIENIFIEQTFPLDIKCANCQTIREGVTITDESEEYNAKKNKVNKTLKCKFCDREMEILIIPNMKNKHVHWKDFTKKESEIFYLSDKVDGNFVGSVFEARGCEVVGVKELIVSVLAKDDTLFKDIEIVDGEWRDKDKHSKDVIIQNFKFDISIFKKK